MPFPWKKVKTTRISQLVNDHLHKSQKRRDGSSLVVETGFPTSLIDLIIKNREKLKKQSKRKRQIPPLSDDANDPSIAGSPLSSLSPLPAAPPPSIAGSPASTYFPVRCPSPTPLQNPSISHLPSSCVSEISVVGSSGDDKEGGDESGADVNRVFWGVLKMFLVVGLALGTKRLTVGITLSAFLLLFLEYMGKHTSRFSKPCLGVKGVFPSLLRSVFRLLRFKEVRLDEKKGGVLMYPGSYSLKSYGCSDQEIQVVQEIQPVNELMEESCLGNQEIEMEEKEESICNVAEYKRKSRRAKIKSKMKELVLKKFKSSRKENSLQKTEIVKDDSFISYEEQPDQCENDELSSVISRGKYREEDCSYGSSACGRLSEFSEEADMKREEKVHGCEAGLTWRHLVLCLIVLFGLIGGRAFALVLTLLWFLLLKLGEVSGYQFL